VVKNVDGTMRRGAVAIKNKESQGSAFDHLLQTIIGWGASAGHSPHTASSGLDGRERARRCGNATVRHSGRHPYGVGPQGRGAAAEKKWLRVWRRYSVISDRRCGVRADA
jgi:hypothetical protein